LTGKQSRPSSGTSDTRPGEQSSENRYNEGPDEVSGRTLVLHPLVKARRRRGSGAGSPDQAERNPNARLAEAEGLAAAIDLMIVHSEVVPVHTVKPGTFFGTGKIDDLGTVIRGMSVDVVVFDGALSPVQQRNLERAWKTKVIDRTGLILEIFGARARTREGRMQVELAHLSYQKSRLVRSWTHLERQRGGFGFLGGPGETQIEADRRMIDERIGKIRRSLETVVRTRELHRRSRSKVPYPVVALVGYTNAGKSTLFNKITGSSVTAEDMLFATLDPTMREAETPSSMKVILSDTVGFISDLPTALIAAFRATLEEVIGADLIIHVRDIANPDAAAQKSDVLGILKDLGVNSAETPIIEAFNKVDLLEPEEYRELLNKCERNDVTFCVSATTGEGIEVLLGAADELLTAAHTVVEIKVPHREGAALAWLHQHGEVLDQRTDEDASHLTVRLELGDVERFKSRFHMAPEGD
jgi:GTPase